MNKESQHSQFLLKFGTKTNSGIPNSMVVFTFSVLDGKDPIWQNIKIVRLSLNLEHKLINNLNTKNSMVVFSFSVLDKKHSFWIKFLEKFGPKYQYC